ncbi:MAG: hypothetical protein MJ103_04180 [Saccharofermentans sp.]|nr:hypothetical protein [Saccharofermentans sp.]
MNLLFIILFIGAVVGYMLSYNAYIKKDLAFFPVTFVSLASVVMYISGFIGNMWAGYWAIVGAGLLLIPFCLVRKKVKISSLLSPVVLFMAIGVIWAYVITRGTGISHADDCSHWYRICKSLYYDNSLPYTADIRYQMYVPGTACWVSFITRLLSFNVPNCFFAQSLINLSCCCSLMSVLPKAAGTVRKIVVYVGVSFLAVLLCALDLSTYSLLVDCTLGLMALAAAVYIICYKSSLTDRSSLIVLTSLLAYTALIKTSGIMLIVFVLAFLKMQSGLPLKKLLPYLGVPVLLILSYAIWGRLHFPDIGASAQAATADRYMSLLSEKPPLLILQVIVNSIRSSLPIIGGCAQSDVFWISLIGVAVIEYRKTKHCGQLTLYTLFVFGIYLLGLIGTYIFSMNYAEAENLACFYRYIGTIVVYLSGIAFYLGLELVASSKDKEYIWTCLAYFGVTVVVVALILDPRYIMGYSSYYPLEAYSSGAWNGIYACAKENTSYSEDYYVVVWADEILFDDGIYAHKVQQLCEAFYRDMNVYVLTFNYVDKIGLSDGDTKALEGCDYLVIVGTPDSRIDSLTSYTSSGNLVTGENPC